MATFSDLDTNLLTINNDINIKVDEDAINNAISNILTTYRGEIPGRPDFGSNIQDYLHELIDEITLDAISDEVENVLLEFEERIEVQEVNTTSANNDEMIIVDITYTVISSGKEAFYSKTFEVI